MRLLGAPHLRGAQHVSVSTYVEAANEFAGRGFRSEVHRQVLLIEISADMSKTRGEDEFEHPNIRRSLPADGQDRSNRIPVGCVDRSRVLWGPAGRGRV